MALVKTDYGLVYNDDGSLCTTIREDDVPFEGVKSFAVEAGTENLFTNPIFTTGDEIGFNYVSGWTSRIIKNGGPFGKFIELEDSDNSIECSYGAIFDVTEGQTYTFSVYANILEWNNDGSIDLYFQWLDSSNGIIQIDTSSSLGEDRPNDFVGQGWKRFKITADAPTGAVKVRAFVYSSSASISKIQLTGFQFEQKPFATSFVDGTRQDGRFYIPPNKIPFNPATDEWIISYWKKPIATCDGTFTHSNTFEFGKWTSANTILHIYWGKKYRQDNYSLSVLYEDGTTEKKTYQLDPNEYFGKWHFEVVRKYNDGVNNKIDYWVNGIKILEIILTKPLQSNFEVGLYVGGYYFLPASNSLIANLIFAFPKDSQGNLVWTDEYIQELYNARKPFKLPANIPVK